MDKEYNKQVGLRLFNRRKELGLTRLELGKKLALHESTIKRYEDGEIKSLDIDKIKEFAKALDTTSAYLMGWEQEQEYLDGIEEARLLKKYSRLSKANKQAVLNLIDNLLEGQSL